MTNARDAQLGFPARPGVFTLLESIGSKQMPTGNAARKIAKKAVRRPTPAKAKPARRLNFQNESWYAAAAARIGAARSNQQTPVSPSPAPAAEKHQAW
jgi:hypothetical protein